MQSGTNIIYMFVYLANHQNALEPPRLRGWTPTVVRYQVRRLGLYTWCVVLGIIIRHPPPLLSIVEGQQDYDTHWAPIVTKCFRPSQDQCFVKASAVLLVRGILAKWRRPSRMCPCIHNCRTCKCFILPLPSLCTVPLHAEESPSINKCRFFSPSSCSNSLAPNSSTPPFSEAFNSASPEDKATVACVLLQ